MCMNMHSLQIHRVVADISRIMLVYFVFPVSLFGVFYPRDAMLARVIEIATCLSVCLSVCPSRAGIVSKRRKLAA